MCERCIEKVGGLEGLHATVTRAESQERAQATCAHHRCPGCAAEDDRVKVNTGRWLTREDVRRIEDEWVRDGLIR